MREMLFRGKRIDGLGWVFGDLLTEYIHHEGWTIVHGGCVYFEVIPETVGQYTGLEDRNGVKIFEGDIVRDKWNCYTPIFQNGIYMAFNVDYLHLKKQEPSTQFNVIWRNGCEIIGNVHDNPELLEV